MLHSAFEAALYCKRKGPAGSDAKELPGFEPPAASEPTQLNRQLNPNALRAHVFIPIEEEELHALAIAG